MDGDLDSNIPHILHALCSSACAPLPPPTAPTGFAKTLKKNNPRRGRGGGGGRGSGGGRGGGRGSNDGAAHGGGGGGGGRGGRGGRGAQSPQNIVIRAGGVQVRSSYAPPPALFSSAALGSPIELRLLRVLPFKLPAPRALTLFQGGVSKAFAAPKPMFIQTGVQLTVSTASLFCISSGFCVDFFEFFGDHVAFPDFATIGQQPCAHSH
jgi:hypothetical protein